MVHPVLTVRKLMESADHGKQTREITGHVLGITSALQGCVKGPVG